MVGGDQAATHHPMWDPGEHGPVKIWIWLGTFGKGDKTTIEQQQTSVMVEWKALSVRETGNKRADQGTDMRRQWDQIGHEQKRQALE